MWETSNLFERQNAELGVEVHTYTPRTEKTEAGECPSVWGLPGRKQESLSEEKKKKQEEKFSL